MSRSHRGTGPNLNVVCNPPAHGHEALERAFSEGHTLEGFRDCRLNLSQHLTAIIRRMQSSSYTVTVILNRDTLCQPQLGVNKLLDRTTSVGPFWPVCKTMGITRRELIAGAAASGFTAGQAAEVHLPLQPRFYLIGAYQQPVHLHRQWRDLGVNTLFAIPQGSTLDVWRNSARLHGLAQIRYPEGALFNERPTSATLENYQLTDPAAFEADMASGELLAAAFFDEPSNIVDGSNLVGRGHGAFDPDMMSRILSTWRGRGVPIWLNQVGSHIRNPYLSSFMSGYATTGLVDWFAADSYPVADRRNWPVVLNGTLSTEQGHDIEQVKAWSRGRPQMAFIETSPIRAGGEQISADQFLAQALSAIIHGSIGHIYFTIRLEPDFSFDASPPLIKAAMVQLHDYIMRIHDNLLIDRITGGRRHYRLRQSAPNIAATINTQMPYPFEGAEIRDSEGRIYRMVLNLTSSTQVLRDLEWDIDSIAFPGYGFAHGYQGEALKMGIGPY